MSGTLSIVIITKNEADHLEAALESVKWADEIIVVDSGSTDETLKIAERFGSKIFTHEWPGFAKQRQWAQNQATKDWIFSLDADERVTPKLKEEIQQVLKENDLTKAYEIPQLTYLFGQYLYHTWRPDHVLRLYPKGKGKYSEDCQVYEKVQLDPEIKLCQLKGDLEHHHCRDLQHFLNKHAYYGKLWADQREAQGKRTNLFAAVGHSIFAFLRHYIFRGGFLDGQVGFLVAVLTAQGTFTKYADLWTRSRNISKH